MMIFYEKTKIARLIPAMITLYSASLLEAGKSKRMACSIISPVRALTCSPSPAPVCREAPSTCKWCVCVDYTNLNEACPKDSFPLSCIDQIVDATTENGKKSFLDAFFGYHQIPMHLPDVE